jgi:hypothetical protein
MDPFSVSVFIFKSSNIESQDGARAVGPVYPFPRCHSCREVHPGTGWRRTLSRHRDSCVHHRIAWPNHTHPRAGDTSQRAYLVSQAAPAGVGLGVMQCPMGCRWLGLEHPPSRIKSKFMECQGFVRTALAPMTSGVEPWRAADQQKLRLQRVVMLIMGAMMTEHTKILLANRSPASSTP